jgi:hypothetical protein
MHNQADDLFNPPSVLQRCGSDQTGKTGWVCNRKFCKHFPIQYYTGQLKSVHEFTVGQVIHPCTRIDSGDPEAAKIPFFDLAVPVSIGKCTVNGVSAAVRKSLLWPPRNPLANFNTLFLRLLALKPRFTLISLSP